LNIPNDVGDVLVLVSLFETPFLFGPLELALISHEPAKAAVVDVASVPGCPLLGA
jgi:hypothetical protein